MCAARARPRGAFSLPTRLLTPVGPAAVPGHSLGRPVLPAPPAFLLGPLPRPLARRAGTRGYCFRVRVTCGESPAWRGTGLAVYPRRAALTHGTPACELPTRNSPTSSLPQGSVPPSCLPSTGLAPLGPEPPNIHIPAHPAPTCTWHPPPGVGLRNLKAGARVLLLICAVGMMFYPSAHSRWVV